MGRLELILGFRGCRREMDMEAENTISITLRVIKIPYSPSVFSCRLEALIRQRKLKQLYQFSVNGWGSLMHNFKTNGNFSNYLSLTNLFRLKISYNDSLSAILKKTTRIQSIHGSNCLHRLNQGQELNTYSKNKN